MAQTQIIVKTADGDGQQATTSYYMPGVVSDVSTGDPAALATAIEGMSDSKVFGMIGHVQDASIVGAAAANAYSALDKVTVYGLSASGQPVSTSIPAPDEAFFNADNETVNISAGAGATLKAAIEAIMKGRDGSAVTVTSMERTRPTRAP